jgi:hypothetical protein
MSEFHDWGEEPPQEVQEITPPKKRQPNPDEPPPGWKPGRATIRAIQGLPPEGEESTPPTQASPAPEPPASESKPQP